MFKYIHIHVYVCIYDVYMGKFLVLKFSFSCYSIINNSSSCFGLIIYRETDFVHTSHHINCSNSVCLYYYLSLFTDKHLDPGRCRRWLKDSLTTTYVSGHAKLLSHVQLFATPWTAAFLGPLSIEFSRQKSGVGCQALLQGIFLTQVSNSRFYISCTGR